MRAVQNFFASADGAAEVRVVTPEVQLGTSVESTMECVVFVASSGEESGAKFQFRFFASGSPQLESVLPTEGTTTGGADDGPPKDAYAYAWLAPRGLLRR